MGFRLARIYCDDCRRMQLFLYHEKLDAWICFVCRKPKALVRWAAKKKKFCVN